MESILASVKHQLGPEEEYEHFDPELIIFINSVLAEFTQMGIGPAKGFEIHDATETWHDFMGNDPRLNMAKTLLACRVRKMFDPPQSSIVMAALNEIINDNTWRLVHAAEEIKVENEEASQNGN